MSANGNPILAQVSPESIPDPLQRLQAIVRILRSPSGCPWDREQSLSSLRSCLLEETYETLEAIQTNSHPSLAEEIGDLLLVLFMLCQIAEEQNLFSLNSVASQICDKLIRRHPHVFGDTQVQNSKQVLQNWEEIKRNERGSQSASALDGVPSAMPALLRCQTLQKKAARIGFDWQNADGPLQKVHEELHELQLAIQSGNPSKIEAEAGDLLFACVNLLRKIGVNAESAAQSAAEKFNRRFRAIEALARANGTPLQTLSLQQMDQLWEQVKVSENSHPPPNPNA